MELKLEDVDGECALVFSEDMITRLDVGLGDELVLTETSGGYRLISAKRYSASKTVPE